MSELLTPERRVKFRVTSCEIRGGLNGTGKDFSINIFGFPLPIIIPP
jgi:hypothetical protein